MKRGDRLSLEVTSVASGGDAFGRVGPPPGLAVFADRGLPGDVVSGRIVRKRKNHARLAVDAWERERAPSVGASVSAEACAHAARCGGCRFWRASYADEVSWKVGATTDAMQRIAREVRWPAAEVVPARAMTGYRGRARLRFDDAGRLGFLARASDEVVAGSCPVLHPALDAARDVASGLFARLDGVDAVFLEWDAERFGVAITGEFSGRDATGTFRRVRERVARMPALADVTTVAIATGRTSTSVVGDGMVHRRRSVGERSVVVVEPVRSFSQANVEMNDTLVARTVASVPPGSAVVELYAGSGNLTFPLLGQASSLDAVEVAAPAVHAAARAYRGLDAAPPARFHAADLAEGVPDGIGARLAACDAVVVDPPRGGMAAGVVAAINVSSARTLVAVSCDPPALARDAGRLAERGWECDSLTFVDMFPRTAHVEAVAVFSRTAG